MILINNVILEQLWMNSKVILRENLRFLFVILCFYLYVRSINIYEQNHQRKRKSLLSQVSEVLLVRRLNGIQKFRKLSFSFVTKPCTHVDCIFVKSFLLNMVCVRQWLMLRNYQNIITYSVSYRPKSRKI